MILVLRYSQSLDSKFSKKFETNSHKSMTEDNIETQRIGKMFDDILCDTKRRKISLATRLGWRWRRLKESLQDFKRTVRNHRKWHKTLKNLHPWDGADGLLSVMQTQLREYIALEEKYGLAEESYKNHKISTAKETLALLERMKEPDDYTTRRRDEVDAKYPDYQSLLTKYKNGGSSSSGRFIAQGNGWTGCEAGKDPREGYFEFVDGRFELVQSPNQEETDRLLEELRAYNAEVKSAYEQGEIDSDQDFERLHLLLKENLYSWWG